MTQHSMYAVDFIDERNGEELFRSGGDEDD